MSYFAFTFDIVANNKKYNSSIFSLFRGLPYPIERKDVNWEINPSELKFRQCVTRDLSINKKRELTKNNKLNIFIMTNEKLNNFFNRIEEIYETEIFTCKALQEILPIYMELRFEILRYANMHKIPMSDALNVLKTKLPHIHDYCETDFRKILKTRLRHFSVKLDEFNLVSSCLSKKLINIFQKYNQYSNQQSQKYIDNLFLRIMKV